MADFAEPQQEEDEEQQEENNDDMEYSKNIWKSSQWRMTTKFVLQVPETYINPVFKLKSNLVLYW